MKIVYEIKRVKNWNEIKWTKYSNKRKLNNKIGLL